MTQIVSEKESIFKRLKKGLSKTHNNFISKIESLVKIKQNIDDDILEELEEILILADIGVLTSSKIISDLQEKVEKKALNNSDQLKDHLKQEILDILRRGTGVLNIEKEKPYVIMVIGVNGTGKTTTIGKLGQRFVQANHNLLLAAGDTFRAAATEQLEVWGKRIGVNTIKHQMGADPSAVIYDSIQAAKARNIDVLIIDTAGRLHTKVNLIEELKKMKRVINREIPGAPHETLLVLDATTGQNSVSQAKLFHQAIGVSGIVLTKLDGTAKGGIITAIINELNIPVKMIGIGEGIDDLRDFNPDEFVEALF